MPTVRAPFLTVTSYCRAAWPNRTLPGDRHRSLDQPCHEPSGQSATFLQVQRFKHLYAHYQRNHDLISVGAYVKGSDPLLDEAIVLYPHMENFLKQGM